MSIKVIKGGMFTTLQDLGRYGWQSFGFSVGGAMDPFALRLANIVLGNDEGEAALEMTMVGPELEFQSHAVIALFGADMSASLDGIAVKTWDAHPSNKRCGPENGSSEKWSPMLPGS